jgi:Protein of unknown function (DUF4235)
MIRRERMWTIVSTSTGLLGALLAKRLMRAGYQATRKGTGSATPFDTTDARFSWPNALLWAGAAGIGLALAKIVSGRVAVVGWEVATGASPPSASSQQSS